MLELVKPRLEHLLSYKAALERAWSPDNVRGIETAREQLIKIDLDPDDFIDRMDDPGAAAGPVILPDGSRVERLPGFRRWIWDGEFCGSLNFRWRKGTSELPAHVLGHVGYSTVPWKQRLGYTKKALAIMLEEIRPLGLPYVDITTEPDNIASQKVALANGAVLVEHFIKPKAYGSGDAMRFRIYLNSL